MLFLILTALFWGVTNPLIKRYTDGFAANEQREATRKNGGKKSFLDDITFLLSRPKYLAAMATNLCGTVFFHYALVDTDISIASVVANALTLAITAATAAALGETKLTARMCIGLLLVMIGLGLCVFDAELRKKGESSWCYFTTKC